MRRVHQTLGRCFAILTALLICAVGAQRAQAQATITNPEVFAVTGADGVESGTEKTVFIFRAIVAPASMQALIGNPQVWIDTDFNGTPENGSARLRVNMQLDRTYNGDGGAPRYVAFITGAQMNAASGGQTNGTGAPVTHSWTIYARDTTTGTPNPPALPGSAAAPKPASTVKVYPSKVDTSVNPPQPAFTIVPVDPNGNNDKAPGQGQNGNGLRVDPQDPTSPNDGGSAHFYTWRVRVKTRSGLPIEVINTGYPWNYSGTTRNGVFVNSPMTLVLTGPDASTYLVPMEVDPTVGGQPTPEATYPTINITNGFSIVHPTATGSTIWSTTGVVYRYRMLPTLYNTTFFGGKTAPDTVPAIPVGGNIGNFQTLIGRPLGNDYVAFGGTDPLIAGLNPLPAYPRYSEVGTTGYTGKLRAGQWTYYYSATIDFRPDLAANGTNFQVNGWAGGTAPVNAYGDFPLTNPATYSSLADSDDPLGYPGRTARPFQYQHPYVTPLLSDGGWTDDLPENQSLQPTSDATNPVYAGVGSNSNRSRVTTKTRVRFQVRVTRNVLDIAPILVRVWISDPNNPSSLRAFTMNPRTDLANNNDYTKGIVYFYDTTFPPGQEGKHSIYFDADDGQHKAIWPRRPDDDVQGASLATSNGSVNFGTLTVGKNYMFEPWVNNKPVLSNGSVSPASGSANQPYTFEVTYTDADGDEPMDGFLVIDNVSYRMTPVDTAPVTGGRKYRVVVTQLPTILGNHTYYFKFRDNWASSGAPIRREYGEYVTLPQGDDAGNPSSQITGPTITSNRAPQLFDPNFFASDAAQTAATQYDFVVRYVDADNDAPASLKVFIGTPNTSGVYTYDGGTAMVKAENSSNYTAGVQYHLPSRVRLPFLAGNTFPYLFKFAASDGKNPDTTVVQAGPTSGSPTGAITLQGFSGSNTVYVDPKGTRNWQNSSLFVYVGGVLKTLGSDYTVDLVNGRITLAAPNTTNLPVQATYFYTDTVGPKINQNNAPTLTEPTPNTPGTNNGTLSPLSGNSATKFAYSIIYTDVDNQAPAYVNVVLDTKTTIPMRMDPATPTPVDYRRGVKYIADTQDGTPTGPAIDGTFIGNGSHTYHFDASDGSDVGRWPVLGGTTAVELPGPSIIETGALSSDLIQPFPKGTSNAQYTFTVTYKSTQGLAPAFPIQVSIQSATGSTTTEVNLNPIDPIGPAQYQSGVRYQISLNAPTAPLDPGTHNVSFGFKLSTGYAASTTPKALIVNGIPVLSSPQPTAGQSFSTAGDITFSVKYTDINGDAPLRNGVNQMKLFIDGTQYMATGFTTTPATPTVADYKAGVTYSWTVPAKNYAVGNHTYSFAAGDDLEDATAVPSPAISFAVTNAALPTLLEPAPNTPATNNGTISATSGAQAATYKFSVIYKHPDNVPPTTDASGNTYVRVIIDEGTANQIVHNLAPVGTAPFNYANGVTYAFTTTAFELKSGAHRYRFDAADRINTVLLPASNGTQNVYYTGPQVNTVPTLAAGTVVIQNGTVTPTVNASNALVPSLTGNTNDKFIFRVTYTDPDGVAPTASGYIRVVVSGTTIALAPKSGDPLNYAGGVVYESAPTALNPGGKTFHFDASDGFDVARYPSGTSDITGLNVANVTTLSAPPANTAGDTTVTPQVGPLSTTFTYRLLYTNLDNTAPVKDTNGLDYVRVIIDEGTSNQVIGYMTKVTAGTNYAAGVEYDYTIRFSQGTSHTYRFEAKDAVNINQVVPFPNTGSLVGPTVNIASFNNVTFNPSPGTVGSDVAVSGTLVISNPNGEQLSVQVIQPDGSGNNLTAQTDATGTFSFKFTPQQTGEYKVRISYSGRTGVYDPLTQEVTTRIVGYTQTVDSGVIDFISVPTVPVSPDPSLAFSPTTTTGGSLSITVLDLIKWLPNLIDGLDQGTYSILNSDPVFPGISGGQGYWIKPSQQAVLNPRGKLADQTQPYSIALAPGWNSIGSVFLTDINWSAVKVRYQGQVLNLSDAGNIVRPNAFGYDKTTGSYQLIDQNGVLKTGRGYWVRAFQQCEIILPPPGTKAAALGRAADLKTGSLQIVARTGNRMDQDNYVPLTGTQKTRMASAEKPPYVQDYVSVRLITSDKLNLPAATRAAIPDQNLVAFEVSTDHKNADVTVSFPNVSTLGRKYEFTLIDAAGNSKRSLGTSSGFTYNSGDNTAPRRFAVVIDQRTANSQLVITALASTGTPSRGVGLHTFNYNINGAASVRAQIVKVDGNQVVRELSQGSTATRGANTLSWDGRDNRGAQVPSGTYMLKLTATDDRGGAANAILPIIVLR